MSKVNKTKDQIAPLMAEGDTHDYKELIEKLEDMAAKNTHKAYDKFYATMIKDDKLGWALVFEGEREETKDETTIREAKETVKKKRIEAEELKEYMRLHKKYGKRDKNA